MVNLYRANAKLKAVCEELNLEDCGGCPHKAQCDRISNSMARLSLATIRRAKKEMQDDELRNKSTARNEG
jgi:hypothetical protein